MENTMKCCILHMAWLLCIRMHSSCGYPGKTCTRLSQFKIPSMDEGTATKTPFLAEGLLVVDSRWGKESLFFMCVLGW